MGDFESQIAWVKRWCARLREDLADFEAGHRYYRNQENITEVLKGRTERDLTRAEQLLKAYEDRDAPRP